VRPRERIWWRLDVSVGVGVTLGLLYTVADAYLDRTIGLRVSTPPRLIEVLHTVIDLILPSVAGALLGVAVHYLRLRARLAEVERQRADALSLNLQKIEREQAVWVISASLLHELKNPLHALGLLLDEVIELQESEPVERRRLLERARAQSDRIAGELAALRSLPVSHKPELPLLGVVEQIQDALLAVTQTAPWAVVSGPPPDDALRAHVNPAYLRIILENLLTNALDSLKARPLAAAEPIPAIAAGRPRPDIDIRLALEGTRCIVEVRDSGPGVPDAVREHVFEPLRTSKPDGMGLGLPISRALARAMGGDLTLAPGPGGAVFRLELLAG
jgi:two-component system, NtrC family, C4-dicarboxylate transport sensor histidine kinase DctB